MAKKKVATKVRPLGDRVVPLGAAALVLQSALSEPELLLSPPGASRTPIHHAL